MLFYGKKKSGYCINGTQYTNMLCRKLNLIYTLVGGMYSNIFLWRYKNICFVDDKHKDIFLFNLLETDLGH
jgi:hypothetical protein